MYKEHPVFSQPHDEDVRVWRYMDFTKLVSLIDRRRLFFSRADKLGDPFEGSWPKRNVAAREVVPDEISDEARDGFLKAMRDMGGINKNWPRFVAVNCWHQNRNESAAMWNLYLKSNEGIAIQSTYSKLKNSLIDAADIFLGKVRYIDYDTDVIEAGNMLGPFACKRKSFEHEQEVRAIVMKWPTGKHGINFEMGTIDSGLEIKTDLELLVENIYVAPNAPHWFTDLVQAVVSRYGYDFNVVQSKLNEDPVF